MRLRIRQQNMGQHTQYRRMVWQCNHRYGGGTRCDAPHIGDAELRRAFLVAFNAMLGNKQEIIAAYREIIRVLTDTAALDAESETLANEAEVVAGLLSQCVQENAQVALDQEAYQKRYNALLERLEAVQKRRSKLDAERMERTAKRTAMRTYIRTLMASGDIVTEFDEELWYTTVECVRMEKARGAVFIFKDGTEYAVSKDLWKA